MEVVHTLATKIIPRCGIPRRLQNDSGTDFRARMTQGFGIPFSPNAPVL
jgi:hypothetical protein